MIIVTGGAGFIGSVLVKALNDRGEKDVVVADTLGSNGKFKNLRAKEFDDIVEPMHLLAQLENGQYKPSAILHIGARTDTSEPDAGMLYTMNTVYTKALAQYAIAHDIRFIYASSASVYGAGEFGFSDDDSGNHQLLPLNPYAFSKWLFDSQAIRNDWTSKITGLRFFNVFGPNEYHKARMASVIWHAYGQVRLHGKMELFKSHRPEYADGGQSRDFIYVKDLVKVVLWFLDHPETNGIYNLGTGQARSFNDLAQSIFAALDLKPKIEYVPTPENIRAAYQYYTQADLAKLRGVGCDVQFSPLEDAVSDYVRGYLQQSNPYI